jgi:iron(III) transport system permease protein
MWNRPEIGLHGTAAMPVLVAVARFAPIAALIALAHARRLDRTLVDAVKVLQPSQLRGWLEVRLALWRPGLVAASAVVFVLTIGELGATLIVAPPGRGTLTMRIYNYLHYGASDTVAGLSLGIGVVAISFGVIAALALGARAATRRLP